MVNRETAAEIPAWSREALQDAAGGSHDELYRLVPGIDVVEVRNVDAPPPASTELPLTVVAWNAARGGFVRDHPSILESHDALQDADVYLLNEMDVGMARSGNLHTVRVLAERLGMSYAYGVEFLELTKGEEEERTAPGENRESLHGNAIVSRFPIRELALVRLSGLGDWFDDYQKRLGGRMALFGRVDTPLGEIQLVSTHLESKAGPDVRARQARDVFTYLKETASGLPVVLGCDLNTWSIDRTSPDERAALAADPAVLERLRRPFEWEPLFAEARELGLDVDSPNDLSRGTYPVPGYPIEARLDWLFARGVRVLGGESAPAVVSGEPLSDHHILRATFGR